MFSQRGRGYKFERDGKMTRRVIGSIVVRVLGCVLALSAITLQGCLDPGPNVSSEPGLAVSKEIGAEGGEVACTSGEGTIYTLSIPQDALPERVLITMTPVTEIANLPLSGGLAGAVELAPEGLAFARPASLIIEGVPSVPEGRIAIGFGYEGDADSFEAGVVNADNGRFTLLVSHFSGSGVGFGTLGDVSEMSSGAFCGPAQQTAILTLGSSEHQPEEEAAVLRDAFINCILPQIQNAANDAELVRAVGNYVMWATEVPALVNFTVIPETSPEFSVERQQAAQAAAEQLRTAVLGNNQLCRTNASLSSLANVLFWQKQAEIFGVNTPQEQLDLNSILNSLCARVVLVSTNLPNSLQVGFPHSLDAVFAMRFDEGTEIPANFEVSLAGSNVSIQNPSGFTGDGSGQSPTGLYTTVITAAAAGPVSISAQACLVLPGSTTPTPVCGVFNITGEGGGNPGGVDLTGTWSLSITHTCFNINGNVNDHAVGEFTLTQNQNAISGSVEVVTGCQCFCGAHFFCQVSGTVSGNISGGVDLTNFSVTKAATDACPTAEMNAIGTLPMDESEGFRFFSGALQGEFDCHGSSDGGATPGMKAVRVHLTQVLNP